MDAIAIIDFGGQTAHLIANRIRRLHVYSEIVSPQATKQQLEKYKGVIFSGGPSSVYEEDAPEFNTDILNVGVPILGICYGHQIMAHSLGGTVQGGDTREFGHATITHEKRSPLLKGIPEQHTVWMSHGDSVTKLPEGFESLATSDTCLAIMGNEEKQRYGLQFHPEVTHSQFGMKLLENFVTLCNPKKEWQIETITEETLAKVKQRVGDKSVFLLVSGGVDSMVLYALLVKALGPQKVHGLHIDTGFMRHKEADEVDTALKAMGAQQFQIIDASHDFFTALENKTDPEEKRKIIGNTFIDVTKRELENLGLSFDNTLLAQGTIYPDTIESGCTKNSKTIKTHHNRVEIIEQLLNEGKVIEPLDQFYKDEVRALGTQLGLPKHLVQRHPFPGPGLAVRALCTNGEEQYPHNKDQVEKKLQQLLEPYDLHFQLLPIKSVGVQGDSRSYAHPVVLYGDYPLKELGELATTITNALPEINRVLWCATHDEPQPFELKAAHLTPERMQRLRAADHCVTTALQKNNFMHQLWQCPTVILPLYNKESEVLVVRPVNSIDAMTAEFVTFPQKVLKDIIHQLNNHNFSTLLYDINHKPPGTIEWE